MPDKMDDQRSPHTQAKTTLDAIHDKKRQKELADKAAAEEMKLVAQALNGIFHTPNGRKVWQYLTLYCGIWSRDESREGIRAIEQNGKRLVLTDAIRPFLEKKTLDYLEK